MIRNINRTLFYCIRAGIFTVFAVSAIGCAAFFAGMGTSPYDRAREKFNVGIQDCNNIAAAEDQFYEDIHNYNDSWARDKAGLRHVECDNWDAYFDRYVSKETLATLQEKSIDPFPQLIEYLQRKGKDAFIAGDGDYSLSEIRAWLKETGQGPNVPCEAWYPLAEFSEDSDIQEHVRYELARYECINTPEAMRIIETGFESEFGSIRECTCVILGKHGDESHLDRMAILEYNDNATVERDYLPVYYVREACEHAGGKIKMRMANGH